MAPIKVEHHITKSNETNGKLVDALLIIKPNRCTNFSNLFLE